MKKIIVLFAAIILFAGSNGLKANQGGPKPFPIPSYKTQFDGNGLFLEPNNGGGPMEGKRRLNIRVTSMSMLPSGIAAVWAYDVSTQAKIGPFYPDDGQIITIDIDNDQWGALVRSPEEVAVDVWIDTFTPDPVSLD